MPKRLAGLVLTLLTLLALLTPGQAVAGPPDGATGKMVLDEVADGLRKYRQATTADRRSDWLVKLVATRDPRVGVALGEQLGYDDEVDCFWAAFLIWANYVKTPPSRTPKTIEPAFIRQTANEWWEKNEADLRRRAAQLPR
jgi:hypothetical protein